MRIVMQKSDWMDDWFCIVKAEHDGREWLKRTADNCYSLMLSERISDADVEGTGDEMLSIAKAIKGRTTASFKRCHVHFDTDGVHFCSPRNSRKDGVVTIEEADELADQIIEALGNHP